MVIIQKTSRPEGEDPDNVVYFTMSLRLEPGLQPMSQDKLTNLGVKIWQKVSQTIYQNGLMVSNPNLMLERKARVIEAQDGAHLSEETEEFVQDLVSQVISSSLKAWGMPKIQQGDKEVWEEWVAQKDAWYQAGPSYLLPDALAMENKLGEEFTPTRVVDCELTLVDGDKIRPHYVPGILPMRKERHDED